MFQENKACQTFRKTNISYSLMRTRTCKYQRVRNVCFSENLACFVFFKHRFEILTFAVLSTTSLFTIINNPNAAAKQLYEDLDKITESAFQWKMSFTPDPSKTRVRVSFFKINKVVHPPIFFNHKLVQQVSS